MALRSVTPTILTSAEIESVAPSLAEIVAIVEDTYRMDADGGVEVPTKIGVHPEHPRSFLHAMPAWVAGARALGMKWISYYPGNFERGLPESTGLVVLNDPDHGLPVAIMEGMWITYARTTACAAVAAKYLAKTAPKRLGLVGCGGLGHWSLRVLGAVFPSLDEIHVASRRSESRLAFCAEMAEEGPWRLVPVDDPRDAVAGMDIVISSTPHPPIPPVRGAWWTPGTLAIPLDVTSGWDDEAFSIADRLVTDNYASLAGPRVKEQRPEFRLPERWDELADVVAGKAARRGNEDERVMAIPTGVASTDMTVAWEIYRRARAAGIGTKFRLT